VPTIWPRRGVGRRPVRPRRRKTATPLGVSPEDLPDTLIRFNTSVTFLVLEVIDWIFPTVYLTD
jgi:hypothetical protein